MGSRSLSEYRTLSFRNVCKQQTYMYMKLPPQYDVTVTSCVHTSAQPVHNTRTPILFLNSHFVYTGK